MARYKIKIAYDGTHFKGFQRQAREETVQSEIERILKSLGWQEKSIVAAGRTDSGVHADGQVIAFDFEWRHSDEDLLRAMNAGLVKDVAVISVERADEAFHPRFDALSRSYRYSIYINRVRNPLLDRYAWRIDPEIDTSLLEKTALTITGTHDFSAFGAAHKPGGSTIRTIFYSEWKDKREGIIFEVTANAFLYHMVRRLVFLQVQVGKGKLELEQFQLGVRQAKTMPPGLAPASGLSLYEVRY
jgi:tRNA pseudouridine38-40 synthase